MNLPEGDEPCTPPELRQIANETAGVLVHDVPKHRYDKTYRRFKSWCETKNVAKGFASENVILGFLREMSATYAASTLWSMFSMLKKTLRSYDRLDLGDMPTAMDFLKKLDKERTKKKSAVFSRSDIERYMREAPEPECMVIKLVVQFSLFGGLRKSEVSALCVRDISIFEQTLVVNIPKSKTGARSFTIIASADSSLDCVVLFHRYMLLRKAVVHERLFLRIASGKVVAQPIGKNMLGKYPCMIAKHVGLAEPGSYTGHAFRRTATTWLADGGIDVINLKRFGGGGWKSDAIAQSYVAESTGNKRALAELIDGGQHNYKFNPKQQKLINGSEQPIVNMFISNCEFNQCNFASSIKEREI
jgi:integrase